MLSQIFILKDTLRYRNRRSNFDAQLMLTACGLWNFYLEAA
jgi:hypothetical protein